VKVYLVGGAVRDQLLGIADENTEKDWLVVGSSAHELLSLGYRQVGKEFPVFLHPDSNEEYALARLERSVGPGYTGFEFDTSSKVTLEQDLSRRDLTINAIAQFDGTGKLLDPYNGQKDIDNGILRHISGAFSEDPVRILRVARFAAKFKAFGFKVAHETHNLMKQMVANSEADALVPERVFKELDEALSYDTPSAFFKVLFSCGAYHKIFPSLDNSRENNSHDNNFTFLDNIIDDNTAIKFSIWLEKEEPSNIEALCKLIKCPKQYQQLSILVSKYSIFFKTFSQQKKIAIFEFFKDTDALRRKNRFADLVKVFDLLGIDVSPIVELRVLLEGIDVSKLDQSDIAKSIRKEKKLIIDSFINST
jgi:tRNA nucleotidyltransferase (CCA-adding enzyme)